jgi:FKBP-type peptidyl-prolyl cis-trans isomerase
MQNQGEEMKEIESPEDVAYPPDNARRTRTGLCYRTLSKGSGSENPGERSIVTVHYSGWTTDGKLFDSSVSRGEKISFPLNGVIRGWTEGVQKMVVGDKTRFWIPADMAYGEKPTRPGAPAGMLVFDIELFDIETPPPPPEVPEDVSAPPASATKTASGLQYRVLQKAEGDRRPNATSQVTVHYSGWTTDGKMFDSSVARGKPLQFGLNQVIRGWTEGVQTMLVGEKTRFWIPGKLAYGDKPMRPGAPAGLLVFDIELLDFT